MFNNKSDPLSPIYSSHGTVLYRPHMRSDGIGWHVGYDLLCLETKYLCPGTSLRRGTRWRSSLRHCATSRKVAGSIPNGVILPSGRTMALGSTQSLTEMSTRNIFWDKDGWCVGLTTLTLSCADCLKIWKPQPPGTLRACPGLQWDCFTFLRFTIW
jgi:hypothetical protein